MEKRGKSRPFREVKLATLRKKNPIDQLTYGRRATGLGLKNHFIDTDISQFDQQANERNYFWNEELENYIWDESLSQLNLESITPIVRDIDDLHTEQELNICYRLNGLEALMISKEVDMKLPELERMLQGYYRYDWKSDSWISRRVSGIRISEILSIFNTDLEKKVAAAKNELYSASMDLFKSNPDGNLQDMIANDENASVLSQKYKDAIKARNAEIDEHLSRPSPPKIDLEQMRAAELKRKSLHS